MQQDKTNHKYFEDKNNQILEMNYINDKFSMRFILPKDFFIKISYEYIEYCISHLHTIEIDHLEIPKFRHKSRLRIENIFKKIGLGTLFTNIDISEIVNNNNINVSDIIHHSYVIIDETGGGKTLKKNIMSMTINYSYEKNVINFLANHPFIYYIRYIPTNLILFIGQYY